MLPYCFVGFQVRLTSAACAASPISLLTVCSRLPVSKLIKSAEGTGTERGRYGYGRMMMMSAVFAERITTGTVRLRLKLENGPEYL